MVNLRFFRHLRFLPKNISLGLRPDIPKVRLCLSRLPKQDLPAIAYKWKCAPELQALREMRLKLPPGHAG